MSVRATVSFPAQPTCIRRHDATPHFVVCLAVAGYFRAREMSFVSEEWRAADADFWKGGARVMQAGSPAAAKKAAPKP